MPRAALVSAMLLVLASSGRTMPPAAELDGYRLWLHSLEQTAAGRDAAAARQGLRLFPLDRTARETRASARQTLVQAAADLDRARTGRMLAPDRNAFAALARARTSLELCRYDTALAWYRIAADLDTAGTFAGEISRESLAAALVVQDTALVARIVAGTAAASDLTGRADEVVLAYRCQLAGGDTVRVDRLIARVAAAADLTDGRVRYWHAFALAWRGRYATSLATLSALVAEGGLSHGLSEAERMSVLTAIPDLMVLGGDEEGARLRYRMLAASPLTAVQTWGTYRQAGLDLAAGDYAAAQAAYARVCSQAAADPWREQACELEEIAGRLARLRAKGQTYGVAYDQP